MHGRATESSSQSDDRLVSERVGSHIPFLSIGIPHYKHRRYLELVLQSLFEQTSMDFEILVSDDCSPDDSNEIIPPLLERSGRPFQYHAQHRNLGYDGNVRFCLSAACGAYVMLLGNDDALADSAAVGDLVAALTEMGSPEVAVTNYRQWSDEESRVRRVHQTGIIGSGPEVALSNFRLFSFVSGIIYSREAAAAHESARWDASIYYQIYLASRIISAGGRLAGVDRVVVAKDVQIDGRGVPNYETKHASESWSFVPHDGGLLSVLRVTIDAVVPYVQPRQRSQKVSAAMRQLLYTSYVFWLFEYRRVANWAFAVGLARALFPPRWISEYKLRWYDCARVIVAYLIATLAGLAVPRGLLSELKGRMAEKRRSRQQQAHGH